jgi:hypothetical protein
MIIGTDTNRNNFSFPNGRVIQTILLNNLVSFPRLPILIKKQNIASKKHVLQPQKLNLNDCLTRNCCDPNSSVLPTLAQRSQSCYILVGPRTCRLDSRIKKSVLMLFAVLFSLRTSWSLIYHERHFQPPFLPTSRSPSISGKVDVTLFKKEAEVYSSRSNNRHFKISFCYPRITSRRNITIMLIVKSLREFITWFPLIKTAKKETHFKIRSQEISMRKLTQLLQLRYSAPYLSYFPNGFVQESVSSSSVFNPNTEVIQSPF